MAPNIGLRKKRTRLSTSMQYSQKEYWDERYQKSSDSFEWFQSYEDIKGFISSNIPKHAKVLHVGCGSSELAVQMNNEGWSDITNIDFSASLISVLKEKHSNRFGINYMEMNVEDMSFATGSFDAIIDKACLDSIMCSDESQKHGERAIAQIYKTLRPGGVFLLIATNHSESKLRLLERIEYEWSVAVEAISKPGLLDVPLDDDVSYHYVFICKKAQGVGYQTARN